jgi:NADH-quinone oxidoreductase subunit N
VSTKNVESIDHGLLDSTLTALVPEFILCGLVVLLLLCNLFKVDRVAFFITIIGIAAHLLLIDNAFKLIVAGAALLTIIISGNKQRIEFYWLIVTTLLGADLLISSSNFIMILLSMEMISISSYVLTAGTTADRQRAEAAWKFFIYGSVATAVMIFGMSYLYGATGSVDINDQQYLGLLTSGQAMPTLGALMFLGGLLFKMTAAPFHLWAPDVYEATPAPIVALLSVVPKIAALVVIMRTVNFSINMEMITTSFEMKDYTWTYIVALIAILSIVVGTLAAINQSSAKRMMAYSSVAQAGFLLTAVASFSIYSLVDIEKSTGVALYYAIVFAIMNYVVFIVVHGHERSGQGTLFTDFSGFGYSSSVSAVAVTLGLVSLAGLPPMAGFMAKLLVFSSIWNKYTETGGLVFLTLFVTGLLATVASLYFYLKIPFYAFFRRSEGKPDIKFPTLTNLLLIILVGMLLALFLAPGVIDGLSY